MNAISTAIVDAAAFSADALTESIKNAASGGCTEARCARALLAAWAAHPEAFGGEGLAKLLLSLTHPGSRFSGFEYCERVWTREEMEWDEVCDADSIQCDYLYVYATDMFVYETAGRASSFIEGPIPLACYSDVHHPVMPIPEVLEALGMDVKDFDADLAEHFNEEMIALAEGAQEGAHYRQWR